MLIGHETSKNAGLETVHEIDKQSNEGDIHDEDETHSERSQVNKRFFQAQASTAMCRMSTCRQEDPEVCLIFSGKPTTFKLMEKTD